MPIPPRPIPTSTRHQRPGASVPRKSLPSSHLVDWRMEVALLNEHATHPRSVPSNGGNGAVQMIQEKQRGGQGLFGKSASPGSSLGREVDLEGLIRDGRGKREKRATTATTLGFDFIPNPSIVALPDGISPLPKKSLLSATRSTPPPKGSPTPSPLTLPIPTSSGRVPSPGLANTPETPGLIPQTSPEQESDEGDMSDWEHIASGVAGEEGHEEEEEEGVGSDLDEGSDEDIIVLGELELEDELQGVDKRREKRHLKRVGQGKGMSYAKIAMKGEKVAAGLARSPSGAGASL